MFCGVHYVLFFFAHLLLLFECTGAVSFDDPNACSLYVNRKKANGQYDKVLQMICCPNYIERDNRCEPCSPGFFGQNCSVQCLPGNWGSQCSNSCNCVAEKTCDPKIGCVCKAGFDGERCDQICIAGRYGINCQRDCSCSEYSECDPTDGSCKCKPGWTGNTCHDRCPDPYYGQDCKSQCSCGDRQSCHPVTGKCICPAGFIGGDCLTACPEDKYGRNCEGTCNCKNGVCNSTDGSCSCLPGYSGKHCNENCPFGTYGDSCSKECSCLNTQNCDPVTGECLCPSGFQGSDCNARCDRSYYGPGCRKQCECSKTGTCDRFDGSCDCDRGWVGSTCEQKCSEGFYGKSCQYSCSCSDNMTCDHVTGDCHCPSGRKGSDCSQVCLPGTYGVGCVERCICSDCDPVTGSCNSKETQESPPMTIYYALGSCAGAIIIIISIFFLALRIRKNTKKMIPSDGQRKGDGSDVYDDIDDYAEISASKMLDNYPANYVDPNDDVKPRIKPRQPSRKRSTNQYLSIAEIDGPAKSPKAHDDDTTDTYTGLVTPGEDRVVSSSYQELKNVRHVRQSSEESSESKSGYLKPRKKSSTEGTKPNEDRYTVDCSDISNPDYMGIDNNVQIDGSSTDSSSGYLKPQNSKKIKENGKMEKERSLNHDSKSSEEETTSVSSRGSESVYLKPEHKASARCEDLIMDDYDRPDGILSIHYEKPMGRKSEVNAYGTLERKDYDIPKAFLDINKHLPQKDPYDGKNDYDTPVNRHDACVTEYDSPPKSRLNNQNGSLKRGSDQTKQIEINYDTPQSFLQNVSTNKNKDDDDRKKRPQSKQRKDINYDFPSSAPIKDIDYDIPSGAPVKEVNYNFPSGAPVKEVNYDFPLGIPLKEEQTKQKVDKECNETELKKYTVDYETPSYRMNGSSMCYDTPQGLKESRTKRTKLSGKTLNNESLNPDRSQEEALESDYLLPCATTGSSDYEMPTSTNIPSLPNIKKEREQPKPNASYKRSKFTMSTKDDTSDNMPPLIHAGGSDESIDMNYDHIDRRY